MPTVPNPYSPYSDIGNAIARLGQAAFATGPSAAQRERMAAEAQYRALMADKARQEIAEANRLRTGRDSIANIISQSLAPGAAPLDIGTVSADAVRYGVDPKDIAQIFRMQTALTPGATEEEIARANAGLGSSTGINDFWTAAGRDAGRQQNIDADLTRATTVQGMSDRAAASRNAATNASNERQNAATIAGAFARLTHELTNKPLTAGAGETVYTAPGDTRGPALYGAPSEGTAKGAIIADAAAGNPVTPMAQVIVGGVPSETEVKGGLIDRNFDTLSQLDPYQREVLGANPSNPGTPRTYQTLDGRTGTTLDGGKTDMHTGEPLPAGTTSFTSSVQAAEPGAFRGAEVAKARTELNDRRVRTEQFVAAADELDGMLSVPDANQFVGALGRAAGALNTFRSQAVAAMQLAGTQVEASTDTAAYADVFQKLGIQNAQLQSAYRDLAFATASAREPGKLTDFDVRNAMETIGASIGDPVAMRTVLSRAVNSRIRDFEIYERNARRQYGDTLGVPEFAPLRGQQAPQAGHAIPQAQQGALPFEEAARQAQDAIARGADPAKVSQRLQAIYGRGLN